MEPMAATAKAPLARPSAKTAARRGKPGPTVPAAASAEQGQRPRRGSRRGPGAQRAEALAADAPPASATSDHADEDAAMLHGRASLVVSPGVSAEDEAGEGLQDQVLRL